MDLGSGIRKKPIPDPGSRGQKGTGSRIRIRNTGQGNTAFYGTLLSFGPITVQAVFLFQKEGRLS